MKPQYFKVIVPKDDHGRPEAHVVVFASSFDAARQAVAKTYNCPPSCLDVWVHRKGRKNA